jgi:hypothetical protein
VLTGVRSLLVALLALSVLAGCGSSDSSAGLPAPTEPATTPTAPTAQSAVVRFDQPSDAGRTCVIVSPRDPTFSYVYFPVTVRSDQPIRLAGIGVSEDSDVNARGAWVAPRGRITDEGLIRGGTGSPHLQSRNLRWDDRMKVSGAHLRARREYTVFLLLRVPAEGRLHHVGGLVVSYRDATGPAEATWVDDIDFRRHC